jgi:cation transport regulator ChaB
VTEGTDAAQERYGDEEAPRRFEAALRAALNMPCKPHKGSAGKGRDAKREATAVNVPTSSQARRQT